MYADLDVLGGESPPPTPKGMLWIPPGVLIAGTPDMPGVQVVMHGFFIDEFPYPNEINAIPKTSVTHEEAQAICEEHTKRLCTELEWERACKGPKNNLYTSSEVYRAADCDTGRGPTMVPPMGLTPLCKSGFGMRDTHGVVAQWTASPWGRGTNGDHMAVRGGGGGPGDVVARCANTVPRAPRERAMNLGFRCCSGERNIAEVTMDVVRGGSLQPVQVDPRWVEAMLAAPPAELVKRMQKASDREHKKMPFEVFHAWRWRPIGNEELLMLSGCAGHKPHPVCGITVGRLGTTQQDGPIVHEPVMFASSGWWMPTLNEGQDARELWIVGSDEKGSYKRKIIYNSGRLSMGEPDRNIGKKKRKSKGTEEK
jgi:hypothetical protein